MSRRFDEFIAAVTHAVTHQRGEPAVLEAVIMAMVDLVAVDDWLPEEAARPHPRYYRQYLLHRDEQARFSVVSFVWGPAQATPVHDHLTWGVIGMLRGAERAQAYRATPAGLVRQGAEECLMPGSVVAVSPRIGDIHRVRNAHDDRVSVSIHVYGADIGVQKRHVFDPETGARKEFVSGYSNTEPSA